MIQGDKPEAGLQRIERMVGGSHPAATSLPVPGLGLERKEGLLNRFAHFHSPLKDTAA